MTEAWLAWFQRPGRHTCHWSVVQKAGESGEGTGGAQTGATSRGPAEAAAVMMMGVPNVGKSTLVNALLNRRIANVGDSRR